MLDDLVTRLRQHEGGARQQCLCRSTQENCLRCECGLAADAIGRLLVVMTDVRKFLTKPDWGTCTYMEGTDVYYDIKQAVTAIDSALTK